MDRPEIIRIAREGTRMVKEQMEHFDGNVQLEYSPESFTGTEMDFALDNCLLFICRLWPREIIIYNTARISVIAF